jgi:hypothetical protein
MGESVYRGRDGGRGAPHESTIGREEGGQGRGSIKGLAGRTSIGRRARRSRRSVGASRGGAGPRIWGPCSASWSRSWAAADARRVEGPAAAGADADAVDAAAAVGVGGGGAAAVAGRNQADA